MSAPGDSIRRILVVDDEPLVCESLKHMLTSAAYLVETAHSAKAALELMERNRFDLVITDYEMPGVKGDELAAAIKAKAPAQPIALITAHSESLQSARVPLEAVDVVLSKPFDLKELRQAVARLLGRPGPPPGR